jgi:hypothetical protein
MYQGTRYLLFLESLDGYTPEKSYSVYVGAKHPWMFPLTNPDYVTAESDRSSVNQYFPGQPLSDILWQIENPNSPYVRPTPTYVSSTQIPIPEPTGVNPNPNP